MYKNQASLVRLFSTKRLQKRKNCTHISVKKKNNRSKPSLRKWKENNMLCKNETVINKKDNLE